MNCNVPRTYQVRLTGLSVDFAGADMMLSFRIRKIADERMRDVGNVLEFFSKLPASFLFPDA